MTGSSNPARARLVEVAADHAGRRLDNFLMGLLPGIPRSRIYRMVRKGEVRVNRGRARQDYRLKAGDLVRVPPLRHDEKRTTVPGASVLETLEAAVIYQDQALLALNKPSGMAVHGGTGLSWGVIEAMRQREGAGDAFLELVHRLDRETSGVLLLARTPPALRELHRQLRNDTMHKRYLALLCGDLQASEEILVDQPLARASAGGERLMVVHEEGRPARTRFRVLRRFGPATLVEAVPETGRTHQIRVHARHLGHPLAGDRKYATREHNAPLKALGLRRLALHAAALTLRHPENGRELRIEAPLAEDLEALIEHLEGRREG